MKKTAAEKKHLSFYDHLTELRQRLIRCLIFVALIFLCMLPFSDQIYTLFSSPMSQALNESSMIAIGVTSPFLAPIKLCLYLALIFSLPFCFYQAWVYASPGLYQSEKNLLDKQRRALQLLDLIYLIYDAIGKDYDKRPMQKFRHETIRSNHLIAHL